MNFNKKIFKLLSKYYNYLDFNIYKQSVDEFTQEYDAVYVNKLLNLITYDEIDGYLTLYKLDLLFNKYCYNDEYREYFIKLKDISFDINYLEELNRFICLDIIKEKTYREKDIKVDDIYLCNPNFIKTQLTSLLKNMEKEINILKEKEFITKYYLEYMVISPYNNFNQITIIAFLILLYKEINFELINTTKIDKNFKDAMLNGYEKYMIC